MLLNYILVGCPCVLARDRAFFKTLFFSGDRGSDLRMVKTKEILSFRDSETSYLNPELSPVKAIETSDVAVASELRIFVTNGYLFRPTNPRGHCEQTIGKLNSR